MQGFSVGDGVDPQHTRDSLAGKSPFIGTDFTDYRGDPVVPGQHRLVRSQCRGDQMDVFLNRVPVGLRDRGECLNVLQNFYARWRLAVDNLPASIHLSPP
jgi:hypothetical protein